MQYRYIHIPEILPKPVLDMVLHLLADAKFVDGKATASMTAQLVKNNLQADQNEQERIVQMQQLVGNTIFKHKKFNQIAMATQLYPLIFSKYEVGMEYGWHVDSPMMGTPPMRTDWAMTLFLSDPNTYEGGELEIEATSGTTMYKPAAGDAVLYPCQSVHRVRPVTKGTRLAAVTWMQSMIRNVEQRELVLQVQDIHQLIYDKDPLSPEANQLLQVYSNLMRMWAEQ
ncbi:MAG: Fe2+-dependent dioxygenase [Spirosomataceae bacterium]